MVQFEQSIVSGSGENGDPAMQIIPPVYQFTPDYTFATPASGKYFARRGETRSDSYSPFSMDVR